MHHPPYFEWRLDRWKIGLALLLWLGLIVFAPGEPTPLAPQGASPIARPGQQPMVGASVRSEAAAPPVATVAPEAEGQHSLAGDEASSVASAGTAVALSVSIWEAGTTPLGNSTPLFYGQSTPNGLVELRFQGRRYGVAADAQGYWQFAPATPLPVGMTWVQAYPVEADGRVLAGPVEQMALIGVDALPLSAPGIVTPLSFGLPLHESRPLLTGVGPPGIGLIFYAQAGPGGEVHRVGESIIDREGNWRWQPSAPLEEGEITLWAVAVNSAGREVSRSWPVTLEIAGNATPSASLDSVMGEANTTR